MTGTQHLTIGLAATAPLALWSVRAGAPAPDVAWLLVAAGVASLVPDLDHDHGLLESLPTRALDQINRSVGLPLVVLVALPLLALRLALGIVNWLVMATTRHRGATHTLAAAAVLTGLVALGALLAGADAGLVVLLALGTLVGLVSHLLADMTTYSGVAVLAPLDDRPYWLVPARLRHRVGPAGWVWVGLVVVLAGGLMLV